MKGAVIGGLIYEGLAKNEVEAMTLAGHLARLPLRRATSITLSVRWRELLQPQCLCRLSKIKLMETLRFVQ